MSYTIIILFPSQIIRYISCTMSLELSNGFTFMFAVQTLSNLHDKCYDFLTSTMHLALIEKNYKWNLIFADFMFLTGI